VRFRHQLVLRGSARAPERPRWNGRVRCSGRRLRVRPSFLPECLCCSARAHARSLQFAELAVSVSRCANWTRAEFASLTRCFSFVISSNVDICTFETEYRLTRIDQSFSAAITTMHAVHSRKCEFIKDQNQRSALEDRSRLLVNHHPRLGELTVGLPARGRPLRPQPRSFTGEAELAGEEEGILGPSRLILGGRRPSGDQSSQTAIRFHGGTSGSNPFPPPASIVAACWMTTGGQLSARGHRAALPSVRETPRSSRRSARCGPAWSASPMLIGPRDGACSATRMLSRGFGSCRRVWF